MNPSPNGRTPSLASNPVLAQVCDEIIDRLQSEAGLDEDDLRREFPEFAAELSRLLPTLRALVSLGTPSGPGDGPAPGIAVEPDLTARSLGDYRVLREVGRGGMGVVYEAVQVSLNRRVALKVLPSAAALDARRLSRFKTESQLAALLSHRNIVPVFAVGCESGVHYYAMQFVAGRTLAEHIAAMRDGHGELLPGAESPPPGLGRIAPEPGLSLGRLRSREHALAAARLGIQAAEALAAAHDEGIVHRDIKPANLMVEPHGHLWVTDFGLARLQSEAGLTHTGDVIGTLRYMSPEQALGRLAAVDSRTDLYSLGITLYELLTLRPACDGADQATVVRQILDEAPAPAARLNPAIPRDLETIVHKSMSKDPRDRYDTAHAMADDLRLFLCGRPILANRPGPLDHALKWARRRWKFVATTAAVAALVMTLTVAGLSWSNARLQALTRSLAAEKDRADRHASEEARQRTLADQRLALADRHLDVARLRLARQALEQGQVERTQEILAEAIPSPNDEDPRGFSWHYLKRAASREIELFQGHATGISCARVLDGGRTLAYGTEAGEVCLLDLSSGELLMRRSPRPAEVNFLDASADGRRLVTASVQRATRLSDVCIWDLDTRSLAGRVEMPAGFVAHIIWISADGRTLSIWLSPPQAGGEDTLVTYDLADPSRPVPCARFPWAEISRPSPRGLVYTMPVRDAIEEKDARTGQTTRRIPIPNTSGGMIEFTSDGSKAILLSAGDATEATVVDLVKGVREASANLLARHPKAILVSDDSRTVVILGATGTSFFWDRAIDRRIEFQPKGLDRDMASIDATLSRDGRRFAYSTRGNPGGQSPIRVVEVATGKELATYPGRPLRYCGIEFHPDGRSLVIASGNAMKRWYFDRTGRDAEPRAGHTSEAWAAAFSPDGVYLATGSDNVGERRTVRIWDHAQARMRWDWNGGPGTIAALAYSPDGRRLATAGLEMSRNLQIWVPAKRPRKLELVGHTNKVRTVAFSPDGRLLASGGSDRTIRLWDPSDGHPLATLEGHGDNVREVAFSPDGRILGSASTDATARFWDVATRRTISIVRGPEPFSAIAFAPDGTAAVADEAGIVRLIEPASGREVSRIHSEDQEVRALAFSADGRTLAAAGLGRVIRLWDPLTGEELLTLEGHTGQINDLAFSPDGLTLASAGHEGAVRLWNGKPPTPRPR